MFYVSFGLLPSYAATRLRGYAATLSDNPTDDNPTVNYARVLTSGGDVDVPAMLYDIKTSASSNERFLALRTEDHAIVKPLGKLADWMITAVTESMCTNLDQMTRDEIMYASDPCNFVMQHR